MNNYESAVYITRDYEMPWGFFNSPFETMEKEKKIKDEVDELYDDRSEDYENKLFNSKK
jgi:hypothetical protein